MIVTDIKGLILEVQNTEIMSFGLDVETTGLDVFSSRLLLIQLAIGNNNYVIPYTQTDKRMLTYLFEIIKARNIEVVGHNIKFDLKFIYHNLGVLLESVFDTQIAEVLCYAGSGIKYPSLAQLVRKYLQMIMDKDTRESFIDKTDDDFTDEEVRYAELDVKVLIPLKNRLMETLKSRGQSKISRLEMKLIPVLVFMEHKGIRFDSNNWLMLAKEAESHAEQSLINLNKYLAINFAKYCGKYSNALDVLTNIKYPVKTKLRKADKELLKTIVTDDEIKAKVIPMINFSSSVQAKYILQQLGVPIKTTNAKELRIHANEHSVIQHILDYREATKRKTSFGEEFLVHVKQDVIHTNYNQLGAATGRFSSDKPNLQNIVADPRYREPFIARPGFLLATVDYSNIELRIIGEASKEPRFIDAFSRNEDLHKTTAALIYDTPVESVTKEQRRIAKSLNFAVVYGTSAKGLAYNFNMPLDKASELLKKYFNIYPVLAVFLKKFGEMCIQKGFTVTLGGRRRFLSFQLDPSAQEHYKELGKAVRMAINTLPQGTSADMIKQALVFMYYDNPFGIENFYPLLTVHDEIVVEFNEDIKESAVEFIATCMRKSGEIFMKTIPTEFKISVGNFWIKD